MFVVTVHFHLRPGSEVTFLEHMLANAAQSLGAEPGCHQFDVCADPQRVGDVFLYEVYADAAAFQDHLKSPHFLSFDTAVKEMVADKKTLTFAEVWQ